MPKYGHAQGTEKPRKPTERPFTDGTFRRPANIVSALATSGGDGYDWVIKHNSLGSDPTLSPDTPFLWKLPYRSQHQDNLIGMRYGNMKVIGYLGAIRYANGRHKTTVWVVRCACGQLERRTYKALNRYRKGKVARDGGMNTFACQRCKKSERARRGFLEGS